LLEAREKPVKASPPRKSKSWYMTPIPILDHLHLEERALQAAHNKSNACQVVRGSCDTDAALKGRDDLGEHENDNIRRGNYTYRRIV
jgi:hypothetical protein